VTHAHTHTLVVCYRMADAKTDFKTLLIHKAPAEALRDTLPQLHFIRCTQELWSISAIVIASPNKLTSPSFRVNSNDVTVSSSTEPLAYVKVKDVSYCVWRFRIDTVRKEKTQEIVYSVTGSGIAGAATSTKEDSKTFSFHVPGMGQNLNIVYCSCNGTQNWDDVKVRYLWNCIIT